MKPKKLNWTREKDEGGTYYYGEANGFTYITIVYDSLVTIFEHVNNDILYQSSHTMEAAAPLKKRGQKWFDEYVKNLLEMK